MGNVTSTASIGTCPVCGSELPPQGGRGQPRRYCSSRCKSRAARDRRDADGTRSPAPKAPAPETEWEATEQLRITQSLTRQAAIDLVAGDPSALAVVLQRVERIVASPAHRAMAWREVAVSISSLAGVIPDDLE